MSILSSDNSLGIGATLLTVFCIIVVRVAIRASIYGGSGEFAIFEEIGELTQPFLESAEAAASANEDVLAQLQDVRDADTAAAATDELPQLMNEYRDAMDDLKIAAIEFEKGIAELAAEYGEDDFSDLDDDESAFGATLAETTQQLVDEFDRISRIPDLPVEFWNVIRVEKARLAVYAIHAVGEGEWVGPFSMELREQYEALLSNLETHGPQQVVSISLLEVTESELLVISRKCAELTGNGAQVAHWYYPVQSEGTIVISPTEEWAAFLEAMPLGEVERKAPASREIVFTVESEAETVSQVQSEAVSEPERTEEPPEVPVAETNESLVQDSPTSDTAPVDQKPAKPEIETVESVEVTQDVSPEVEPIVVQAEPPQLEPVEADEADSSPIEPQVGAVEQVASTPTAFDPEEYKQLARDMLDGENSQLQSEAIEALLATSPESIEDRALFKQIARNFRQLTLEPEEASLRGKAIEGLVHYGGKYSVPILVEVLEEDPDEVPEELIAGLEKYPSLESAVGLVKLLGDKRYHDKAVECLYQMDAFFEKALFTVARDDDPETSAAALSLLAEVGTPKSFGILRRVIKGRNKEDRALAKAAMREIRLREAAKKQAVVSK